MRQIILIIALLLSSAAFSQSACDYSYFSGWNCGPDGYADYCSVGYDSQGSYLYESAYIACPLMPNSYGCFAGACACYSGSCVHGTQYRDCSCTCSYPWAGQRCDTCTRSDYECGNGGYINRQNCQCACPNACLNGGTQGANCACTCKAPWSGQRCETCTRSSSECANGGYMDASTCKCVCPNKCQNGGVQDANCGCSCPSPWTGSQCQNCALSQANCENGSTLNINTCQCTCSKNCNNGGTLSKTCGCNCAYPWNGNTCDGCSISANHCLNNATFTASACACDCTNANSCLHGAHRTADYSCGCDCSSGWGGPDCASCTRDATFCERGGTFKAATCNCDCAAATCKNGKLNEKCQCVCAAGYKGDDCSSVASAGASLAPSLIYVAAAVCAVLPWLW